MRITALEEGSVEWELTADAAEKCSWRAGKNLAQLMREGKFRDWERAFAAIENGRTVGFCTLTRYDELPEDCGYSPFIGYVFVDEVFRGHCLSGRLIDCVCHYAESIGFKTVYVCSGELGFYEKLGFRLVSSSVSTVYGTSERLFVRSL